MYTVGNIYIMPEEKTLFPDVPNPISETPDKITKDFMDVARDSWTMYVSHFNELEKLLLEKDSVADTDDPTTSNKRTNPGILHNSIQKTVEQFQRPFFQLFASEASENVRATMQGLAEDILHHANWVKVLENKKVGAQRSLVESGDVLVGYDINVDGNFPLQYYKEESNRYFVNKDAIEMRDPGGERDVRKRVIVKEYQWEQAVRYHPEIEGKATLGALPIWYTDNDFRFNQLQEKLVKERRIQIAYCIDMDYVAEDGENGIYCIIAGGNQFKFGEKEGADFPDKYKNKFGDIVIPEGHLTFYPKTNGFWNYGLLQILYKIGVIHSKLLNMGVTYTLHNSNPVRIVATNTPSNEFKGDMAKAMRDGNEGKLPIMTAADGKEFGGVTNTSAPAIINEANAVLDLLEKQLGQLGININGIITDSTKTLGALQLEVVGAAGIPKYVQTTNASEYQFLIEQGLYMLSKRKADDSDIPLVSSVKIRTAEGENEEVLGVPEKDAFNQPLRDIFGKIKIFRSFNLEDFKNLWNTYEWKVIVSGGVVNNPVLEDALDRNIQQAYPGSKAANMAASAMYQRHGRNYTEEDFVAGGQGQQEEIPQQAPQAMLDSKEPLL